jgi:predicted PurR-regulated permease PerM
MVSDQDFARRMIQTVLTVAAVAILIAIFWAAREALLLVYISALTAMGFSPLVQLIEQPRAGGRLPAVPRWLAILVIYLSVVAVVVVIGMMVVPPLVAQSIHCGNGFPTSSISHSLQAAATPHHAR